MAEGGGLLNRVYTFSQFRQYANQSQWFQGGKRIQLSKLAARQSAILTRFVSASVGTFRRCFRRQASALAEFGLSAIVGKITQAVSRGASCASVARSAAKVERLFGIGSVRVSPTGRGSGRPAGEGKL